MPEDDARVDTITLFKTIRSTPALREALCEHIEDGGCIYSFLEENLAWVMHMHTQQTIE